MVGTKQKRMRVVDTRKYMALASSSTGSWVMEWSKVWGTRSSRSTIFRCIFLVVY
jgi:hypothetical protein